MNKSRMAVLGAVAAFALLLIGGAGPAAAQTAKSSSTSVAKPLQISGTAKNGKKFTGTYTIQRFKSSGGQVYAVGTLKGRLKGRRVTRRNVAIPATVTQQAQSSQITPTPGACRVLSLQLGAIDLNVLGLRIRTTQINALIEAVPGANNLLGNLLCTVTGLLDPNGPASQIATLLNAILAILQGL